MISKNTKVGTFKAFSSLWWRTDVKRLRESRKNQLWSCHLPQIFELIEEKSLASTWSVCLDCHATWKIILEHARLSDSVSHLYFVSCKGLSQIDNWSIQPTTCILFYRHGSELGRNERLVLYSILMYLSVYSSIDWQSGFGLGGGECTRGLEKRHSLYLMLYTDYNPYFLPIRSIQVLYFLARLSEMLCQCRWSNRLSCPKGGLHGMPPSYQRGEYQRKQKWYSSINLLLSWSFAPYSSYLDWKNEDSTRSLSGSSSSRS